jgi:hypothetical protein
MRGYQTLIQEAELMVMPPYAISEFLKRRASQGRGEALDDPVDEDTERALRSRGDPLIDLAIARYGRHMSVVAGLFNSAEPGSPVRLACLSNRALGSDFLSSFPEELLGKEAEPMAQWLLSATAEELSALFENPSLSDGFLREVLERGAGWESLGDSDLLRIVSVLPRNPRMWTAREDEWMDGYADYSYASVFNAAWGLVEAVPTSEAWAATLGWLYEKLQPDAFSIKEPLILAARWQSDPGDVEASQRQAKDRAIGYLGHKERVRKGLARLALSRSPSKLLGELLTSADIALRAAAYAEGEINSEQLWAGYRTDGYLAYNEAIRNLELWRRRTTRQALRDIAWDVVKNDKHSDLMAANLFDSMDKRMREMNAGWFCDEDEDKESSDDETDDRTAATKADVSAVAASMDRQSQNLDAIGRALRVLESRTNWVWWFALGAFVASLWQ